MPLRASLLLTSALTVVALGLVGCGAEPQRPATSLPEPATSSAAEPTPELPPLGPPDLPMPDEARMQDEAGAEAFLRYWFELFNDAQGGLDSTHVRDLSQGCATCEQLAAGIDADREAGQERDGGEIQLGAVSNPLVSEAEAQLAFNLEQRALTVFKDGSPVEGLGSEAKTGLSGGAILRWDSVRETWSLVQLDVF